LRILGWDDWLLQYYFKLIWFYDIFLVSCKIFYLIRLYLNYYLCILLTLNVFIFLFTVFCCCFIIIDFITEINFLKESSRLYYLIYILFKIKVTSFIFAYVHSITIFLLNNTSSPVFFVRCIVISDIFLYTFQSKNCYCLIYHSNFLFFFRLLSHLYQFLNSVKLSFYLLFKFLILMMCS